MKEKIVYKRLSELKNSETGLITKVHGHGNFRKRITEMGFVRGKFVEVIKNAPMMDPVEYEIMGYHVALRREEAELIEVSVSVDGMPEATADLSPTPAEATFTSEVANRFLHRAGNVINVALVGNPNSGKTSLFNVASGSNERVGNYGGVTVEVKKATFKHNNYIINIVDLPGTYSITEYTPEELYVREHITGEMPDVVINVVDASNLERNLFLTTQLIDMNLKVVMALNMADEMEKSGATLDYSMLGQMLGIPIVPTIASKNKGIYNLFETVAAVFEDNEPTVRHIHINYGGDIEAGIEVLQNKIWKNHDIVARFSSRYLALKLLEGDSHTAELLSKCPNADDIINSATHETAKLEKIYNQKVETTVTDAKYGFIAGALEETYKGGETTAANAGTARIDNILTHRYWGIPIFIFLMWLMFQATFTLGAYPAEWIEAGVKWLGNLVGGAMNEGSLKDLVVDGIIAGVGGVVVFLPNILILFFFISLMEDTGYMARAAFIMDKAMHRIGLHGKSFIPLIMGFGCNVPAIMATRTLESRKDRIITMLIMPFMSCSARLPVYVLLISAFFARHQGLVLLSIYGIGIVIAVISSLAFKKIFFNRQEAPFVMELPPYRVPTSRSVVRHMWGKGVQYLRKMGTVILVASVLIWALGYYPRQAENSYLDRLGHIIEPAIRPLGFNWQIGVSLLSGAAAKEIVVSSMAVIYNAEDEEESLVETLRSQEAFSPLVAYSMMVFILLYFPCIAAIAAVRREAGARWAWFTVVYTTCVAWVVSFLIYNIF